MAALHIHTREALDQPRRPGEGGLDFQHGGWRFGSAFAVYVAFGVTDALIQCWSYWVMSQLALDDVSSLARYAGGED